MAATLRADLLRRAGNAEQAVRAAILGVGGEVDDVVRRRRSRRIARERIARERIARERVARERVARERVADRRVQNAVAQCFAHFLRGPLRLTIVRLVLQCGAQSLFTGQCPLVGERLARRFIGGRLGGRFVEQLVHERRAFGRELLNQIGANTRTGA